MDGPHSLLLGREEGKREQDQKTQEKNQTGGTESFHRFVPLLPLLSDLSSGKVIKKGGDEFLKISESFNSHVFIGIVLFTTMPEPS
jgi:hypothetical protein